MDDELKIMELFEEAGFPIPREFWSSGAVLAIMDPVIEWRSF